MGYLSKMLLPIGLGVTAAILNWVTLRSGTAPVRLVQVKQELRVGDTFKPDVLAPLELPASYHDLTQTAIPFAEGDALGMLSGQPVQRHLSPGDIVFYRDTLLQGEQFDLRPGESVYLISIRGVPVADGLLKVGNDVSFRLPVFNHSSSGQWVGPFRLVTVGSQVTVVTDEDQKQTANSIGVAYRTGSSNEQDKNLQLLENFIDQQRKEGAELLGIRLHQGD